MDNLDTFLSRYPPFDSLTADELHAVVADARAISYDAGQEALVEDGSPAVGLWVVLTGSMEIVHEGETIQILEPGELFGHPSLLTGMAPAFSVRAHEPASCALLPAQAGRRVLGTEAGAAYVAQSMRKRLTRAGHTVHGLLDVGTTPVSAIMRKPTFCGAEETVRTAAQRLGEHGVAALLVDLPGADGDRAIGIVTDAEVRAAVVAGGGALERPVAQIARTPVPTVPVGQLAVEATIDMLAAGSDVVAVLDSDGVVGVLSAGDLLGLDARSPIALRHTILGAADEDGLVRSAEHLPRLFLALVRAGVPSRDLGRVLTLQHDAVVARLVDFSVWRNGAAPLAWSWLNLGSAARRELTLASDQDNALAYADPPAGAEDEVDAYFERLGSDVNAGLARCGIGVDNNGVLAGKRLWRMPKSAWLRTFDECFEIPDESHLIRATVAFDFRPGSGGLAVAGELTSRVRAAGEHAQFMRLMARTAIGYPVALGGVRGQLAVGKEGDPPGKLDIKRGAIIPLVNLVRFHALANCVTISNTLDRIEAVAHVGGLERDSADALGEAFTVISAVRFEHHAELIAAGSPPDNLIDPDALRPIARADLRAALSEVKRAQKQLGAWAPASR